MQRVPIWAAIWLYDRRAARWEWAPGSGLGSAAQAARNARTVGCFLVKFTADRI